LCAAADAKCFLFHSSKEGKSGTDGVSSTELALSVFAGSLELARPIVWISLNTVGSCRVEVEVGDGVDIEVGVDMGMLRVGASAVMFVEMAAS